jgi:ABC-type dipeptide/oligopeptide/nickel transport system permease component
VSGALRLGILLLAGSLAAFTLARAAPGDPAMLALLEANQAADPAALAALRASFGTDQSLLAQYLAWLGAALTGDLGLSFRTGQPVVGEVLARLPVSLGLGAAGLALAALLALAVAPHAAARPGGVADRTVDALAIAGQAVPAFWIGALLLWVVAAALGVLPALTGPLPARMALPVTLIAFAAFGPMAATLRATLRGVARSIFHAASLARGAPAGVAGLRRVGRRHALAALVPVLGAEAALAAGGAAVLETLFGLPGLGAFAAEAARARDWPAVQGALLTALLVCVLAQGGAETMRRMLDPRPGPFAA